MPRRFTLDQLEPNRVCLIKPSSLGDVVHATPVLSALRERWPNAHIAWVVNHGLLGLIDGLPELDEVIAFNRAAMQPSLRGVCQFARFLSRLGQRGFDVAIDLQGLFRSGLMTRATGAPIRVGCSDAREGATFFYTHRVPMPRGETHAVDRLLHVASALGANIAAPRFQVATTPEDIQWARRLLGGLRGPRVVINVGARWQTKRWPAAHFATVGRYAVERRRASLIAVGAPEDRPLVEALKLALEPIPILDLCGRTSLPNLAALAAACDLFLSNDTGPLHVAAAAGAPVVAVFTCTNPALTGPYTPNARVVPSHVPCAASCIKTCSHLSCMTELSPERVWRAVDDKLKQRDLTTPSAA